MSRRDGPKKDIGSYYPCERPGCESEFKARKSWQRFCSRQCREKDFYERAYVSTEGELTPQQIASVVCAEGHPGVKQQ